MDRNIISAYISSFFPISLSNASITTFKEWYVISFRRTMRYTLHYGFDRIKNGQKADDACNRYLTHTFHFCCICILS